MTACIAAASPSARPCAADDQAGTENWRQTFTMRHLPSRSRWRQAAADFSRRAASAITRRGDDHSSTSAASAFFGKLEGSAQVNPSPPPGRAQQRFRRGTITAPPRRHLFF